MFAWLVFGCTIIGMAKVEINKQAPDFTLVDYAGISHTLSHYKNEKNILLVFNRGFVWPYCRAHMTQLRQDYKQFQELATEIIVVGPEGAAAFKKYWTEHKLPFVGLPNKDHTVLKLYGQQIKIFKLGRMPAQVIIDKAGMARYIHYGHNMADIPKNADILTILDELNKS